jgi:hypothetical protein
LLLLNHLSLQILKWNKIPAVIFEEIDDLKVATLSAVENLQRIDLNIAEKMEAFNTLYEMFDKRVEMVAQATGYTKKTVKKYLKINKDLDHSIKQEIKEGDRNVTVGVLEELVGNINIKREEQKKYLEIIGNRSNKEIKRRLRNIKEETSFTDTRDILNQEELIKKFIQKYIHFRINNPKIKDYIKNLYQKVQEFIEKIKNLTRNMNGSEDPIKKIIHNLLFDDFLEKSEAYFYRISKIATERNEDDFFRFIEHNSEYLRNRRIYILKVMHNPYHHTVIERFICKG